MFKNFFYVKMEALSAMSTDTETGRVMVDYVVINCTARQCSPLGRKFMECYIIKPAQSLLMKHLVIGQR